MLTSFSFNLGPTLAFQVIPFGNVWWLWKEPKEICVAFLVLSQWIANLMSLGISITFFYKYITQISIVQQADKVILSCLLLCCQCIYSLSRGLSLHSMMLDNLSFQPIKWNSSDEEVTWFLVCSYLMQDYCPWVISVRMSPCILSVLGIFSLACFLETFVPWAHAFFPLLLSLFDRFVWWLCPDIDGLASGSSVDIDGLSIAILGCCCCDCSIILLGTVYDCLWTTDLVCSIPGTEIVLRDDPTAPSIYALPTHRTGIDSLSTIGWQSLRRNKQPHAPVPICLGSGHISLTLKKVLSGLFL